MGLVEFSVIVEMEKEDFESNKELMTELLNNMEDLARQKDLDIYSTDYREV